MKKIMFIIGGIAMAGLSGCALSTETVNLQPKVSVQTLPKATIATAIKINPLTDARGVSGNLIIHKLNGYGDEATGGYTGNVSLASYMQTTLTQSFQALNYHLVQQGEQLTLTGRILAFTCTPVTGLLSGSYQCNLQIEFSLDSKTQQVWDDVISGYGSARTADPSNLGFILSQASNNLVRNLLSNTEFQAVLQHPHNTSKRK